MERMSWKDDERLYNPRIHSQRIRELHALSVETGQPMTYLVDMILRRYYEENSQIPSPPLSDGCRQDVPEYASMGNENRQ